MYGVLLVTLTHIRAFNDGRESLEYIVHHTVWAPAIAVYLNRTVYSSYFSKTNRLGNKVALYFLTLVNARLKNGQYSFPAFIFV